MARNEASIRQKPKGPRGEPIGSVKPRYVSPRSPGNMLMATRKMQMKGAAILGGIQPFGVSSVKMICVMLQRLTACRRQL